MGVTSTAVKGIASTLGALLPIALVGIAGYLIVKNTDIIGRSVGTFAGTGLRNLGSGLSGGFNTAWDMFGGVVNPNTGGAASQDDPNVTIANSFKNFVSSGTLSREFAESYSFQPPARSGQLDVSKTFAYIASPTYRANQEQANLNGGNYGGFGTEQAQTNALAGAIQSSAEQYPEWFA